MKSQVRFKGQFELKGTKVHMLDSSSKDNIYKEFKLCFSKKHKIKRKTPRIPPGKFELICKAVNRVIYI